MASQPVPWIYPSTNRVFFSYKSRTRSISASTVSRSNKGRGMPVMLAQERRAKESFDDWLEVDQWRRVQRQGNLQVLRTIGQRSNLHSGCGPNLHARDLRPLHDFARFDRKSE